MSTGSAPDGFSIFEDTFDCIPRKAVEEVYAAVEVKREGKRHGSFVGRDAGDM